MTTNIRKNLAAILAVTIYMTTTGCLSKSDEEYVAQLRAEYVVELNNWTVVNSHNNGQDGGQASASMREESATATATASATAAPAAEEEEIYDEDAGQGPEPRDVLFDLVVLFRGRKSLPGITVDISHKQSNEEEKEKYQVYVETDGMVNGETQQVETVLEGLVLEDDDDFSVDLVEGVPADLSKYREFSELTP